MRERETLRRIITGLDGVFTMEKNRMPSSFLEAKRGGFFEVDDDFMGANIEEPYESIDQESHDEFIRRQNEEE